MNIIESLFLGILQGITEFLPISSSGHLVLTKEWLNKDIEHNLIFEVIVHFGTLCSILVYYRKTIYDLTLGIIKELRAYIKQPQVCFQKPNTKLLIYILLSMIPAGILGFLGKDSIEIYVLGNPYIISGALVLNGLILYSTRYAKKGHATISLLPCIAMAITQAMALMPGISRSGFTISCALWFGIDATRAAKFSFLMVIPIIFGATLLTLLDIIDSSPSIDAIWSLIVGFIAAFISGYLSISFLIYYVKQRKLQYFAFYCIAVGIISMILFIV